MLNIWSYWHQGFDKAPWVVSKCVERLEKLHPTWKLRLLDQRSIYQFADPMPIESDRWEKLSLQHKSDLFRTQLLIKYGGVWIDPTVFCTQPIHEWLPSKMDAGLFLFSNPGPDRIISNWFIAANAENHLLERLYDSLINYWNSNSFRNVGGHKSGFEKLLRSVINGRSHTLSQLWLSPIFSKVLRLHPYMIYHFTFYRLIQREVKCREIWERMPKVLASGPHLLKRLGLDTELSNETRRIIDQAEQPLYKLTWKVDPPDNHHSSVVTYLFHRYA